MASHQTTPKGHTSFLPPSTHFSLHFQLWILLSYLFYSFSFYSLDWQPQHLSNHQHHFYSPPLMKHLNLRRTCCIVFKCYCECFCVCAHKQTTLSSNFTCSTFWCPGRAGRMYWAASTASHISPPIHTAMPPSIVTINTASCVSIINAARRPNLPWPEHHWFIISHKR